MGLSPDIQESADLIMQGLATLMERQQAGANNLPAHLLPYDQADFRSAALGAFVELGELVNECQWKPWRQYGPPTEAEKRKVHKEFGDLLHMLAWMLNNLAERFNIGPDDIALGFMEAHLENVARFKGEVPGREPPRDPNIGMTLGGPIRVDKDHQRRILAKVAETLEADGTDEERRVATLVKDYVNGELSAKNLLQELELITIV
jgi:hypothetical protein